MHRDIFITHLHGLFHSKQRIIRKSNNRIAHVIIRLIFGGTARPGDVLHTQQKKVQQHNLLLNVLLNVRSEEKHTTHTHAHPVACTTTRVCKLRGVRVVRIHCAR